MLEFDLAANLASTSIHFFVVIQCSVIVVSYGLVVLQSERRECGGIMGCIIDCGYSFTFFLDSGVHSQNFNQVSTIVLSRIISGSQGFSVRR